MSSTVGLLEFAVLSMDYEIIAEVFMLIRVR